jgi:hypothetical protein
MRVSGEARGGAVIALSGTYRAGTNVGAGERELPQQFLARAADVAAVLEGGCTAIGYPHIIRLDQGSEFISREPDLWACAHDVTLDFSRRGEPADNAFVESFSASSARIARPAIRARSSSSRGRRTLGRPDPRWPKRPDGGSKWTERRGQRRRRDAS